jgi:hypothetical protein
MRDAGLNRKAKALEMLGHYVRGSKLAVTKLWMLVQVTANLDKFRLKGCGKMLNFAIGHFEINLVECMLSASGEEIANRDGSPGSVHTYRNNSSSAVVASVESSRYFTITGQAMWR